MRGLITHGFTVRITSPLHQSFLRELSPTFSETYLEPAGGATIDRESGAPMDRSSQKMQPSFNSLGQPKNLVRRYLTLSRAGDEKQVMSNERRT